MKLVIVESPTKEKTIGKYLGKDYQVFASRGHVRDIATTGKYHLGVDIDSGNFETTYEVVPARVSTIKRMESLTKKADEVYLATDPDREGEAISWHIAQVLNLDSEKTKRLEFNEITPYGILNALKSPRNINSNIVASQETRRVIDRIIGFRLSYLLQNKMRSKSGGRVQSVVLGLIVQKEKEIEAFVPQEYYDIYANVDTINKETVKAKLIKKNNQKITIESQEDCDRILQEVGNELSVESITKEDKAIYPRPPLTTSSLQQEAYSNFGFTAKKTMEIAQTLYEGVEVKKNRMGLITYMRTDSIRISPQFINQAKDYISQHYGEDYVGHAYHQKADSKIQDAHEAIRPTNPNLIPSEIKDSLTDEQYKLYSLIFVRAIASIMKPKETIVTTANLFSNDYLFEVQSVKTMFDGFSKMSVIIDTNAKENKYVELEFADDSCVKVKKFDSKKIITKAPNRYSEGQLVKKMEETGIGRPSTYAATIEILKHRAYITSKRGVIYPTTKGIMVSDALGEFFPKTIDVHYTAELENELDRIEDGNIDKISIMRDLNTKFEEEFANALSNMPSPEPTPTGENCPLCGKPLVNRTGSYGDFVGCSGYPECHYIKPKEKVIPANAKICPKCHKGHLLLKHGKNGNFLACDCYPECDYTTSFKKNNGHR